MSTDTKHLLGLQHLSLKEIQFILEQTKSMKTILDRSIKQTPTLRGKTLVNMFFEPSTRTRVSFEMAIKLMGAGAININIDTSSVKKGESLLDTVKNVVAMGVDGIIIRHQYSGAAHFVAQNTNIPVINAGDGYHEHPTQGLLDIFTMIEKKGDIKGANVCILGDIRHSRVARSNIWGLKKLGANIFVAGPPTLMPPKIEKMGVKITPNLDELLPHLDFINVLRIQFERQETNFFPSVREYRTLYALTEDRLEKTKKDVVIMHPGPINRGVEIDSPVADGARNVILDQVTNGVAVRMAVLYQLLLGSNK